MTVVLSCPRGHRGGSPTGVVFEEAPDMSQLPAAMGVSHVGLVRGSDVRFFTGTGELVNCGHGLIAVQAARLLRTRGPWLSSRLRVGGRPVRTVAVRTGPASADVWFDQGLIALSPAQAADDLLAALGIGPEDVGDQACVASPGTPRMLLPVRDRAVLDGMAPDAAKLARWCRKRALLGCFVYAPSRPGVVAGRMFAPAVGVPEDALNANSAGCLAAWLHHRRCGSEIVVHQGDRLGRPGTVRAAAVTTGRGTRVALAGAARLIGVSPAAGRC